MARTGLYFSEVKKARDSLLAAGKHPSVDAVRVALGNTGSKTTIHKYLKQLAAEEPDLASGRPTLSDTIAAMVADLAQQLEKEASVTIVLLQHETSRLLQEHATDAATWRSERDALRAQLQHHATLVATLEQNLAASRQALQDEVTLHKSAQQDIKALQERLDDNEKHRLSLEEKHQQARLSLEHFREAAREQRERESRRQENQVQHLQAELRAAQQGLVAQQEELISLNRESSRLAAELGHAAELLDEARSQTQRQSGELKALRHVEEQTRAQTAQLEELTRQVLSVKTSETALMQDLARTRKQLQDAEMALARAQATLAAQADVLTQFSRGDTAHAARDMTISKRRKKQVRQSD